MSLGLDIAGELPHLRAEAESMMVSACTITSETPGTTLDEETGQYVPNVVTVYSGKCRLKFGATQANVSDAAGQLLTTQSAILSLPIATSGDEEIGHVATITSNPADPALVGKQFRITGLHFQTSATARRLTAEIIS